MATAQVTPIAITVPQDQDENGMYSDNVQGALVEVLSKNIPDDNFTVKANFTRMHPNLTIPVGVTITVEEDGEIVVI